ncbi:hypothetical protein HYQ46_004063 [Verticillium longisporum]|nr:hypothetical protein HYQ46_004063 [Verticillium longisporum]
MSQLDPVVSVVTFVFVALDEVPPQDKVLGNVVNARSNDTHGDVVPRHTAIACLAHAWVCVSQRPKQRSNPPMKAMR